MDQKRDITPEKQLLNIIEDPKAGEADNLKAKRLRRHSFSWLSLGALKGRISFAKNFFSNQFHRKDTQAFSIRSVNNMMTIVVVALAGFLIMNIATALMNMGGGRMFKVKSVSGGTTLAYDIKGGFVKPLNGILLKIRGRDIFKMGELKKSQTQEAVAEEPKEDPRAKALEAVSHLRLVGISWSSDPDAMIEDTKAVRTFFVKTGQKIGKVTIEAIFKDKVILEVLGQEVELK